MTEWLEPGLLLLGLIVALGYTVQTAVGFGAGLVAITLGAQIYTLVEVLSILVPLSLFQTSWVAYRHRSDIARPYLVGRVLPLMGGGMLVGFWTLGSLEAPWLSGVFAGGVLLISLWELAAMRQTGRETTRGAPAQVALGLLGSGITHGIFACGGPLLAWSSARYGLDKGRFRATLTAVWVLMNTVLCSQYALAGRFEPKTVVRILALLPWVPVGIIVGSWLHHRVDERSFRIGVYGLLGLAALALLAR